MLSRNIEIFLIIFHLHLLHTSFLYSLFTLSILLFKSNDFVLLVSCADRRARAVVLHIASIEIVYLKWFLEVKDAPHSVPKLFGGPHA